MRALHVAESVPDSEVQVFSGVRLGDADLREANLREAPLRQLCHLSALLFGSIALEKWVGPVDETEVRRRPIVDFHLGIRRDPHWDRRNRCRFADSRSV